MKVAIGGGIKAGESFDMNIDFTSHRLPDTCECCEYRQYVMGEYFTRPTGTATWIPLPGFGRNGAPITAAGFVEDGIGNSAYGYRAFNGCADDFEDMVGGSDRAQGCFYRGSDWPGIRGLQPGTDYRIHLTFRGDAVTDTGVVLDTNQWVVDCTGSV